MKISVITSILIMVTAFCFAQNFPRENVDMLLGKQVRVNEKKASKASYPNNYTGYKNFYTDFNKDAKRFSNTKPFPIGEEWSGDYFSEYSKMVNKVFTVTEATKVVYEGFLGDIVHYALKLESEINGTLYYEYSPKYETSFELTVIGGLDLPEDFYWGDITEKIDKFTGKRTQSTPLLQGISFDKITTDNSSDIYIYLRTSASTCNVMKQGMFLLFENGEQIKHGNANVKVDAGAGYFIYTTYRRLNSNELNILKTHLLTDYRLYIYDATVKEDVARILREYIKYLTM